ncbi:MAG: FHA domain-containing protein [Acidobacteriaceae bacterium]|nr:FHA domain-containing protein [Acidobacteriaceae bacterium]
MAIPNVLEKLGRAIFESPFGVNRIARDAPELAEIRLAVLDAVKAKSHRAGGKNVFPFDLIRVELLGIPEEQAPVFTGGFLTEYLTEEIKTGLARSSFRFPHNLRLEIQTSTRLPAPGEAWLSVETRIADADQVRDAAESAGPARLVVQNGTANCSEFIISKPRINIGRTAEVFRPAGPSRKNDLAFTEENEINRTVSREHAHILRSKKDCECRLFNDRWYKGEANCGLWIVREGLSQPVHRGSRGTVLKPGDEIHLGTAVLKFVAGVSEKASE